MNLTLAEKAEIFKFKMKGIDLFAVSPRVFNYYRREIHKNWKDNYITCCKKLYRNYHCGQEVFKSEDGNIVIKMYGNLKIVVNTELNEVVNLENIRGTKESFTINEHLKNKLNKKLKIN